MIEFDDSNSKIISISCGREHTLCLDQNGKIWVFGVNTNGELGIGQNKEQFEWIDQPICINDIFSQWNGNNISNSNLTSKSKSKKRNHHHHHHHNTHKRNKKREQEQNLVTLG